MINIYNKRKKPHSSFTHVFKEPSDAIETYRLLFKIRHAVNVVLIWSIAAFFVLGLVIDLCT